MASRKGWQARRRMKSARCVTDERGGAPAPKRTTAERRQRLGTDRIAAHSEANPGASSAVIAEQLGITPGAVRKAWERAMLPRRSNRRPAQCASKSETSRDDPRP